MSTSRIQPITLAEKWLAARLREDWGVRADAIIAHGKRDGHNEAELRVARLRLGFVEFPEPGTKAPVWSPFTRCMAPDANGKIVWADGGSTSTRISANGTRVWAGHVPTTIPVALVTPAPSRLPATVATHGISAPAALVIAAATTPQREDDMPTYMTTAEIYSNLHAQRAAARGGAPSEAASAQPAAATKQLSADVAGASSGRYLTAKQICARRRRDVERAR
jgi:hypothetical protein